MNECLNGLIIEYSESLKGVRGLKRKALNREDEGGKRDASILSSMERDIEFAMEYMVTGYMPQYSEGQYKKVIPVDPQKLLTILKVPKKQEIPWYTEILLEEKIKDALKDLSPQETEAVLLVKGQGFSYGETAAYLKIKKATVQKYVERAYKKIVDNCHTAGLYK